jgi:hypothetical protein
VSCSLGVETHSLSLTLSPSTTPQFKNNNLYQMNWDDFTLDVYVCQIENVFPQVLNCGSDYTDVLGTATYASGGKFHTKGYGSIDLLLDYDLDVTKFADVARICAQDGVVIFVSEGSVHASLANGHSFGYVDVWQEMYLSC